VKNLHFFVYAIALVVGSCGQRETATSLEAIQVAASYCAQDFKPYFSIIKACNAETENGRRGASCAAFEQADAILTKRRNESGFKACPFPEVRWGPKASEN
jgi:hypothetical protein